MNAAEGVTYENACSRMDRYPDRRIEEENASRITLGRPVLVPFFTRYSVPLRPNTLSGRDCPR